MSRGVLLGVIGGVVLLVVISLVMIFSSSKTTTTTGTDTLTIWSPFDENDTYQAISKEYFRDNKNAKIVFKYVEAKDAKDYEAQVVNAIANGTGPDIWLSRSDWLTKHIAKSYPSPNPSAKQTATDYYKALIEPSILDNSSSDGKVYGIPLYTDSLALIVNTEEIDRIIKTYPYEESRNFPKTYKTWEELSSFVRQYKQTTGQNITRSILAMGLMDNTTVPVDTLAAMLAQKGVVIKKAGSTDITFGNAKYDAENRASFPAIEALDYLTSFSRADNPNYNWSPAMGDPLDAFIAKKTLMMVGYHSTVKDIIAKKPSFNFTVAPLPQLTDDETARVDYAISWTHLVNKSSVNKDKAWKYLDYLAKSEVQTKYAQDTNRIDSTKRSNIEVNSVPSTGSSTLFKSQNKYGVNLTKPEWQTVDSVLQDTIRLATTYAKTPQNAIDTATERFREAFGNATN